MNDGKEICVGLYNYGCDRDVGSERTGLTNTVIFFVVANNITLEVVLQLFKYCFINTIL